MKRPLTWILILATIFAFAVIVMGAYTRITDAGLGCPDWPGCYHQLTVPTSPEAIAKAQQLYPDTPVEIAKAYSEMIHRYIAGTLGLIIFGLTFYAYRRRKEKTLPVNILLALSLLVIFQAALGMWTVTLKLLPLVVMAHLLGGFTILSLLAWAALKTAAPTIPYQHRSIYGLSLLALVTLSIQIFLGGWTSANYAALVCPDFPTCHGQWWPSFSYEAFYLFKGFGLEAPLTAMQNADRITIQMAHRLGALLSFIVLSILSIRLVSFYEKRYQRLGFILMALLLTQVTLGIANIALWLPVPIAVLHNATAALLLVCLVFVLYFSRPHRRGI